jgi:biotin synthase
MKSLVEKLIQNHELEKEEYVQLLRNVHDKEVRETLQIEAVRLRKKYYGNKIYIRGLIEFTNYCQNNCYYCGIQARNNKVVRYRLTHEEILECCKNGYELGFRTFVLQGGEDLWFTDEKMIAIIQDIKKNYPDCALTLSIGEKSYETYQKFRQAGVDRYLLRHETANEEHYQFLHPCSMDFNHRQQCLYDLKSLGYQVGAGFMVGSPKQTLECLAEDLIFLKKLSPQMVGIGPFIPHHETIFADQPSGSLEMTLFLLSIIRIILPQVLLPATTALGTIDPHGRERGILAGANVIMPNLSPVRNRKQYDLYDHKICMGEEAAECRGSLEKQMISIGYEIVNERGDYKGGEENV